MAQYDQLTQVPNRELLRERFKAALATARAASGRMAVLYIDLDRFKQVNDTYGHGVGDMLLQAVASRLRGCIRETDTVARIGGDEFVVLLHSIQNVTDAERVQAKIRRALAEPLRLDGHCLSIAPKTLPCSATPTRRCTQPSVTTTEPLASESAPPFVVAFACFPNLETWAISNEIRGMRARHFLQYGGPGHARV
jgi:GGDEF domain-containing protein